MTDEEKKSQIDKIKKELAKLEWEENLLRKRDDRLKWEQEMLEMEEGLKNKRDSLVDEAPAEALEPKQGKDQGLKDLDQGTTYLLLEDRPHKSIQYFKKQLGTGSRGLFITRSNPKKIQKEHELGAADLCWLTGVKASEDVKSVSGLQELSILVSNFIDEDKASVILLDGLEYLVSNNDFPIVLRLVQQIRDKVSTAESVMVIPLNSNALDAKQLTLLERECQTLK